VYEKIFAAARDAVGEEPIAAGGAHDLRTWETENLYRVNGTKIFLPPPVTPSERNRSAWAVGIF